MRFPSIFATLLCSTLLASPAQAQDFYVGGGLAFGDTDTDQDTEASVTDVNIFAGGRLTVSNGIYVGAEVQVAKGQGYSDALEGYENTDDSQTTTQAELHIGYQTGPARIYGFVGTGKNDMERQYDYGTSDLEIKGIGVEYAFTDNLAVRIEAELSELTIDACDTYDYEKTSISCGVSYTF